MSIVLDNQDDDLNPRISENREINKSIQLYQQFYQHITGTTEKTKQKCSDNLLIDIDEIKQLHHKIEQISSTHNVILKNVSIIVLHSNDRKEQFTSFERFIISTNISTSPTLSLIIKYNFAILPNTNDSGYQSKIPNHYEVLVKLNSKIAIQKEIENDAPPFMRGRLGAFMIANSAEITIEYADYIVARGFIETFKEWSNGCKRVKEQFPFIKKLQYLSHYIPPLLKLSFSLLLVICTYLSINLYVNPGLSLQSISKYLVISFGAFFIVPSFAKKY